MTSPILESLHATSARACVARTHANGVSDRAPVRRATRSAVTRPRAVGRGSQLHRTLARLPQPTRGHPRGFGRRWYRDRPPQSSPSSERRSPSDRKLNPKPRLAGSRSQGRTTGTSESRRVRPDSRFADSARLRRLRSRESLGRLLSAQDGAQDFDSRHAHRMPALGRICDLVVRAIAAEPPAVAARHNGPRTGNMRSRL